METERVSGKTPNRRGARDDRFLRSLIAAKASISFRNFLRDPDFIGKKR